MSKKSKQFDAVCVDQIKINSCAMVESIQKGNFSVAMSAAPILYALFKDHLVFNLHDPRWINRDRFILSDLDATVAYYSILRMLGVLQQEDLERYAKSNGLPIFPQYDLTKLIEATINPSISGVANAVGIAISQAILAKKFNEIDHMTYVLCNNAELQSGNALEALSLAGTLKLNKLVVLYNAYEVMRDSFVNSVNKDNEAKKFAAMGFNYIKTSSNFRKISKAIAKAKHSIKPTIIQINTTVAKNTPFENSIQSYSHMISFEEISDLKDVSKFKKTDNFAIYPEATDNFVKCIEKRNTKIYQAFNLSNKLERFINQNIKINLNDLEDINIKKDSELYSQIINSISDKYENLVFCSANLTNLVNINVDGSVFASNNRSGRTLLFGQRHYCIGDVANGIALHSNFRPIVSTIIDYIDFSKHAITYANDMHLPIIYLASRNNNLENSNNIFNISMLRTIPNILVLNPYNQSETKALFSNVFNANLKTPVIFMPDDAKNDSFSKQLSKNDKEAYYVLRGKNPITILTSGKDLELCYPLAKKLNLSLVFASNLNKLNDLEYKKQLAISIENTHSFSWTKYAKYNIASDTLSDILAIKNHIDFSSSNIEKALKKILQSLNNKIKSSKKS